MQREYEEQGFFRFIASGGKELKCLKPGERDVNTTGRIIEATQKELITREGTHRTVVEGVIADYTAKMPFLSWIVHPQLVRDRVIRVENAYVRRWNGLVTLYFGRNTNLYEAKVHFPDYNELNKPHKRTIGDIIRCRGAFDIIVEGDILDDGDRMVVDDGTGALVLVLQQVSQQVSQPEQLLSFGTPVIVRGDVILRNEYVLIAKSLRQKDNRLLLSELVSFMARYTVLW